MGRSDSNSDISQLQLIDCQTKICDSFNMALSTTGGRLSCLIVLPGCGEGVSSQSFIQCFTLTHSAFTVQLATPGGKTPEFINQDDQSRRWLNDFRTKPFAVPLSLEIIDPNRYTCLLIPHSPGAAVDLCLNKDLGQILIQFIKDKKFVCAIGLGVAGLLSARSEVDRSWGFKSYSLTGSSVFELARKPNFANLVLVPEDAVRDCGGCFSSSEPDCVHVVVDRHLVTGQNEQSTLTAVQNLVLLCNQSYINSLASATAMLGLIFLYLSYALPEEGNVMLKYSVVYCAYFCVCVLSHRQSKTTHK